MDINLLAPLGKKHLPFQVDGIRALISCRHALLAFEPGLGKTCTAIGVINHLKLKSILIVCPASVKLNWYRELLNWLTDTDLINGIQIIYKKTDVIEPWAKIIVVNYDLLTHSFIFQQLTSMRFDIGIFDESHYLKNMKADRTKSVLSKNGIVHRCTRTLMMTGTPVLNRPIELYPVLKVLARDCIKPYDDYYRFGLRFCDGTRTGFCFDVSGASNTDDLNKRLKGYMIRRLTKDVYKDLPPKRYQLFFINQDKKVGEVLWKLEDLERNSFRHQSFAGEESVSTLRREMAEQKLDHCIPYIKDILETEEKLVVFAYHTSVINRLREELKSYGPRYIDGSCSASARQSAIEAFQKDVSARVFIGQIQAAGVGIDGLQNVSSHVVFIESSWVPGEIEQAVKRVHRIGQTKPVLIQFIVWADSVEEHMMRVALDKVNVIRGITK